MKFTEGVKFIRPEDQVAFLSMLPDWIGWHQAERVEGFVRIPLQLINGQRAVLELSDSYIMNELEAPSVDEFLSKKIKDYPPSEDNTYSWAKE